MLKITDIFSRIPAGNQRRIELNQNMMFLQADEAIEQRNAARREFLEEKIKKIRAEAKEANLKIAEDRRKLKTKNEAERRARIRAETAGNATAAAVEVVEDDRVTADEVFGAIDRIITVQDDHDHPIKKPKLWRHRPDN